MAQNPPSKPKYRTVPVTQTRSGEVAVNALQSAEVDAVVGVLHADRIRETRAALMHWAGVDRIENSSSEEIPWLCRSRHTNDEPRQLQALVKQTSLGPLLKSCRTVVAWGRSEGRASSRSGPGGGLRARPWPATTSKL